MLIEKNEELIEKLENKVNDEIKSIVVKLDAEKLLIFLYNATRVDVLNFRT